ncbi:MAG TPA: polysaccharide biosynthesis/export family protein [Sphingomicrobium sp.]|nr:polysaccharide biosynthesis/export family protein [Sphingomicrobium sp.]
MNKRAFANVIGFALAITLPALGGAQAPSPAAAMPAYRINPGDELEISVWGEERLQRVVHVLPDGTFAFPLVGQVVALGKLPGEIERLISAGLQPQYRGAVPQVTVSVKSPAGFQFSVIGKVRNPGTFTPGRYVNALEALSMAGGPTEFAQIADIRIVRKEGQELQTFRIRVSGALKGQADSLTSSDIPAIRSGDTLVVP